MISVANPIDIATIDPTTGIAGTVTVPADAIAWIRPLTPSELAKLPTALCAVTYIESLDGDSFNNIEVYSPTAAADINASAEATFTATVTSAYGTALNTSQTWYFGAGVIYMPSLVASGSGCKFSMMWSREYEFIVSNSLSTIKSRIEAAKAAADLPTTVMLTNQDNLMATDNEIAFRTTTNRIFSSVAGQLDVDALTELELTAPTIQENAATEYEVNAGIIDLNATTTVTVDGTAITTTGSTSVANVSGAASVSVTSATGEIDATGTIVDINSTTTVSVDGTVITSTGSTSAAMVSGAASMTVLTAGGEADITATTLDINATTTDITGVVLFADGAVGAPSVSNTDDPDTGVYWVAANQLGLTAGGVLQAVIGTTGLLTDTIRERVAGAGVNMIRDANPEGVNAMKMASVDYDFVPDGGAVGVITLPVSLPDNAVVTRAWYEVRTTFTSAADTATVALGLATDAAAGIVAAIAINDGANPWDAGFHDGIPNGAAANFTTKLTAARAFILTVAVQDLTAGALTLHCEYFIGA